MNLLEALRYLAALDQHRHFGRAAMACRITQPALSNAIRALESELGVPVVRRSRQYEGLTAEGEVVLAHAHRLLREAEAMRQELHSREEAPRGRLQIGAVPTAMTIATRFALRVRERHGGLAPVVRSLSSPVNRLAAGARVRPGGNVAARGVLIPTSTTTRNVPSRSRFQIEA